MRHVFLAVALFAGCRCGPEPVLDGGIDPMDGGLIDAGATDAGLDAGQDAGPPFDEFDAWREMRGVLTQSPDAVPARARQLVASRDLDGLFRLVRDDVALLPTDSVSFDSADTAVRWGARATLRGQAGTPRERAELLALLARRAGFSAVVVTGSPDAGSVGLFRHGPQREVRYAPTDAQLARWNAALPGQARLLARLPTPLDADGGVRAALRAQLSTITFPTPPPHQPFDATLSRVPLVKLTLADGGVLFANPNVDGARLGESGVTDEPAEAFGAGGEHEVTVTVLASRSSNPAQQVELGTHTFRASDVGGRTITTAFITPLSLDEARKATVDEAQAFIPVMVVRGDELDTPEASQRLSFVGTPFLRDGTAVLVADGGVRIAGELVLSGPTAQQALTSVSQLRAQASAPAFPEVELEVAATNAAGMSVAGLASDAFVVEEGTTKLPASVRRNRARPPSVVVLFDRSTSIPAEFLMGASAVGHAVADAIFTQFPGAQVQVAAVDIGGATVSGGMVGTLAEVDTQLAALNGVGSDVWTSLDSFSESNASLVVCVTDAVVDTPLEPEQTARLVRGPPVLLAGVGTVDAATAQQIADVTSGRALLSATAATLPMAVTALLGERQPFTYQLVYRAPAAGSSPRTVKVSLAMPGTASTTAQYTPPSTPVAPAELSALFLRVETGGAVVTRLLAGSPAATAADKEAVRGALFGRYVLTVEAGNPSFSTLLDEHLAERLQMEPAADALRGTDDAAIIAAGKTRLTRAPPDARFFGAPLPDEANPDDVTFANGLTVSLRSTIPVLGQKRIRRFDLLPLVPRETVALTGGRDVFRLTLERTLFLAAFESQRYPKNTHRALAGRPLAIIDSSTPNLAPGYLAILDAYSQYLVVAPTDSGPVAAWAVHPRTGEVIGVMPEGGLGEEESTDALVERLTNILDAAGRAGEASGYNGIKEWADLEKTKVTLLGGVIKLFNGEGQNPRRDLENNLCESGADQLGGPIPGYNELGEAAMRLQQVLEMLERLLGRDLPDVPSPGGALCMGLLGP